jgi:hypothetical protein
VCVCPCLEVCGESLILFFREFVGQTEVTVKASEAGVVRKLPHCRKVLLDSLLPPTLLHQHQPELLHICEIVAVSLEVGTEHRFGLQPTGEPQFNATIAITKIIKPLVDGQLFSSPLRFAAHCYGTPPHCAAPRFESVELTPPHMSTT